MKVLLGITDYVVISLMLAVSASVGLYFRFTGGRQKTTHEFLMAGKEMSIFPVAFSLMATYMSAISVLGLPSETYLYGTQYIMWLVAMPIGGLLAAYGFLPVFYETEAATAYEYLEKRFGKITRTISSALFTLQMIFYMAVVLYAPSLALNAVTGLSTWTSVITLAGVCTFYCSLGGLKAVLWTDVFQSLLMYVTVIAIVVKGCLNVGGFQNVIDIANKGGRLEFFNITTDITVRYTLWNSLLAGILYSTHTFGTNQAQIQRMLSVGNLKKAQMSLIWSIPLILVFNIFCFLDGVVLYSNFADCDPLIAQPDPLSSADQLVPFFVLKMFHQAPGLAGLCIAGVFSASLSTISSAMNSLTAVTMEDFIRPYCFCKRLTESWAAFLAKILAIVYGGLCLFLTFVVANFRGVLEASNVMFGMVGGPMLGIYILGMMTKSANEPGTLIGLLIGFAINAWMGFGSYAAKVKIDPLLQSTEGCNITQNSTSESYEILILSEPSKYNETIHFEDDSYIHPAYKMSFLWFPIISTIVVIIVGYISSFVISFFIDEAPTLKAEVYSPFVRKWFFKTYHSDEKQQVELQNSQKSTNENNGIKEPYS